MSTTKKLRLGPLPSNTSVKLTFACPAGLKADLDRYAALHAQTYGEAVDAAMLIPHMLEAFMGGDLGFSGADAHMSTVTTRQTELYNIPHRLEAAFRLDTYFSSNS